ncbi:MAG: hypothetical protein Aureis2KO_33430 [Aureisphaera sp.]
MKPLISLGREIGKPLFFWLSLLLCIVPIAAQTPDECFFVAPTGPDPNDVYSYDVDENSLTDFDPIVFNIFFWGMNDLNGDPGWIALSEEHCLTSVSHLNRVFNEFGIYFKYKGMDTFNTEYYDMFEANGDNDFFDDAKTLDNQRTDAFNIYVASGGAPGGAAEDFYVPNLYVHHEFYFREGLMVHEIAHCLGLYHTFQDFWAGRVVPQYCGSCENEDYCEETVTRNPLDPNYNATFAGDRVTDTPAVPNFRIEWCRYNGYTPNECRNLPDPHYYEYVDSETFVYSGPGTDCLEFQYNIDAEDVKNYVSYSPAVPAGTDLFFRNFTAGQKIRMHESIAYDPLGQLAGAQTTVQALYEPYKGDYAANGAYLGPQVPPTFQPGFDYEFVSCGPYGDYPPPPDYNDTSFWYINGGMFNYSFPKDALPGQYDDIIHRNNFAIRIQQLDYNGPRNCFSTTGPASDGTVLKFEDGVFNTNVTIIPKDSTQINDPNLVNDLNPGLYKIEKNHSGGAVEETVILKQNDF